MKKLIPILLTLLLCTACINDDLSMCAGKMYFNFSYIYGGTNRFYELQKADMTMHFYHAGEDMKYREMNIPRTSIGAQQPLIIEKELTDVGALELISWSTDEALEYINTADTPKGEGYVQLKEITEGSGICRPVKDLFYGHAEIDAGDRLKRCNTTIAYERPICRIRLTMVPSSVQTRAAVQPGAEAYTMQVYGTRNKIDDSNTPGGENIILTPDCAYDENTGNILTDWFGAIPSAEGEYLKIDIFLRDTRITTFDCTKMELAAKAGDFIDLEIDGRYIRPQMEVTVNGWHMATVMADM